MANYSEQINTLYRELDGAIVVMLVDAESGLCLFQAGGNSAAEAIGAGITQFTSLYNATLDKLDYPHVDETTFTIGDHFQVAYRLPKSPSIYLIAIVDRRRSNLGTARVHTRRAAAEIEI